MPKEPKIWRKFPPSLKIAAILDFYVANVLWWKHGPKVICMPNLVLVWQFETLFHLSAPLTRLFVETSAVYTADRVSWHNKLNSWNRPTTVTVKILLRCKLCYCIFLYCNLPMSQVNHVQVRRLQNYHARAVVANSLTEPYFVRAWIKNVCTIQLACCIGTRGLQMCCFLLCKYTGWSDIAESMVAIRSPFCGYNTIYCVELNGE